MMILPELAKIKPMDKKIPSNSKEKRLLAQPPGACTEYSLLERDAD